MEIIDSNKKALVLMNHTLNEEQVKDLQKNYGVDDIVYPTPEISDLWRNIPPEASTEELRTFLTPVFDWVEKHSGWGAYLIIAGEPTATFMIQNFWLAHLPCKGSLIATTKRESIEETQEDGSVVKRSVFKHVRFRVLDPIN